MNRVADKGGVVLGAARGLLIEGIPGTGKTCTIRQIQRIPAFSQRASTSLLMIGEEMTQRTLERRSLEGSLSAKDHIELLDEILLPLEQQQKRFAERGWDGSQEQFGFTYLLERFHFTHVTNYGYMRDWDFSTIEERLNDLSGKGCLLVMDPEVMKQRIIDSRPFPAWRKYISRYGESDEKILAHYLEQQERMRELVQKSKLNWLVINTSEANWSVVATSVWKHWMAK